MAVEESPDQWAEEVAHEWVVAGVVAGRVWSVGRGDDPDRGGTDHHEAADACTAMACAMAAVAGVTIPAWAAR